MSDKPMFLMAGVYASRAEAEADYDVVKALHSADEIGSYDSAIIEKERGGKVRVTKTEKPTQHGAWIGLAAGAATAIIFPVALPALVTGAGAGLGAWIGHLAHGMSREDARDLGQLLDEGQAALIVVGVDKDAERIEKALTKAQRSMTKRVDADFEEAEREASTELQRA
jgi:uncharacterized membrane protein